MKEILEYLSTVLVTAIITLFLYKILGFERTVVAMLMLIRIDCWWVNKYGRS